MTFTSVDPEKAKKDTSEALLLLENFVQFAQILTLIEAAQFPATKDILSLDYKPTQSLSQEFLLYEGKRLVASAPRYLVMVV